MSEIQTETENLKSAETKTDPMQKLESIHYRVHSNSTGSKKIKEQDPMQDSSRRY